MSTSSSSPAGRGSSLTWLILMSAFFLSGIAGLIYESIWTHYLKLYLGHASYAQVLVLAAFLTGMAGGAWIASRLSLSGRNLLRSYALVEVLIGLLGMVFHQSFVGLEQWSFDVVIPQLSAPASIFAFKWALALLIVTPQSVLLGMTFPLMVGGVLRMFTRHGGRTIASFYFVNSLGASIGVWVSGFYLIGAAGLPGTVLMAAMLNLLVGLVVFAMVRGPGGQGTAANPDRVRKVATGDHTQLLLLCAFGTGFASFIYEISWIRMLNLVLGTTTHAFELMLGTFILGMAIGSLAIRRYLDKLQDPLRFLGLVQLFMAVAAGATMVLYNELFSWMELLLRGLSTTVEGYAMFNIMSLGICVVVMLPATICAGMTLPLITHTLRSEQGGEAVVGRVYAVNTLGSIAGVALVSAVLIPVLGLKWALFCGVLADLGLGALLLYQGGWRALLRPLPVALGLPVLLIGPFAEFEPGRMMSGVYSRGQAASQDEVKVVYYKDGPTASVGVKQFSPGQYTVLTNGKPDAGLRLYDMPASVDETTMVLLGALPLAVAPGARDVAVVGFGSGVTTQTLLLSPDLVRVDTIEIEPRMIDAARTFAPRVARVFDDPRSHLHVEDAKSFFSTSGRRYDIIISEPSNPWVSGVAGLFSTEYYKGLKRYLNPDGVLAQWIHIYSFDNVLLVSIMKALGENFQHYNIYQLNTGDVLVLASQTAIASPADAIFGMPDMAADLKRIGVHTLADLDVRFLSGDNILQPWLASLPVPPNSDYFPLVDLGAVRARFLEGKADLLDYAHSAQILLHPADWRSALAAASINHLPKDIPMAVETLSMEQHLLRGPGSETLDMLESGSGAFAALLRIEALLDRCELHAQPQRYIKNALLLARQANTYARSDVWIEFWGKHLAAACAATASPQTREFIRFLQVVAAGDDAVISGLGRRVLANAGAAERDYVLRNVIAADLRMNQRAQARALWEQEGAQSRDLVLQMLALGMLEP